MQLQRGTYWSVGWIGIALALAGGVGCGAQRASTQGRVLASNGVDFGRVEWLERELDGPIAVREVRRTEHASHHVVRLAGAERPHVHDRHDLTVFVMSGRVEMHMGDLTYVVEPGDVIQVPHGMDHWAKNLMPEGEASEAYIVFSPPFDGADTRLLE